MKKSLEGSMELPLFNNFELEEFLPCGDSANSAVANISTIPLCVSAGAKSFHPQDPRFEGLSVPDLIVVRLLEARERGLTTFELFSGLKSVTFTRRISDARQKGHDLRARKLGLLPNGGRTVQWRYFYAGFNDLGGKLKPAVIEALERWKAFRNSITEYAPWEV